MISFEDRAEMMVRMYGEVCSKTEAAKILGCTVKTVYGMLEDERLDPACGGTKVDVRSIARYIAAPKKEDFEARKRRIMKRNGSGWAV